MSKRYRIETNGKLELVTEDAGLQRLQFSHSREFLERIFQPEFGVT